MRQFLLLLVLFFSSHVWSMPAQILIIRHGEKPTVGDEGIHLSPRGQQRAEALVDFFLYHPKMNQMGVPVALFAASAKKQNGSVRPYETLLPLSEKMNLQIIRSFKSGDEAQIATEILNNPQYDGKNIVICWVRDELPLLAQALGIAAPPKWASPVFNQVWKIEYYENGKSILKEIPQNLLPGD